MAKRIRPKGLKYTGEATKKKREGQQRREAHKKAIIKGEINDLPEQLTPKEFETIREIYWECLKAVEDPRQQSKVVYPLWLILHRIISGLLGGAQHITPLFPAKHRGGKSPRHTLGDLPTQPAVNNLLRRIDWQAAQVVLAPLWDHLGFEQSLIIRKQMREPNEIIEEFNKQKQSRLTRKAAQDAAYREAKEAEHRTQGMSAAQAKLSGKRARTNTNGINGIHKVEEKSEKEPSLNMMKKKKQSK